MPGKKSKKSKKNSSRRSSGITEKRVLTLKEDMEEYAKIMKALGDRKMNVILPDGTEMVAAIPGKFRKRCWMTVGDIVLVSRRDFQDSKLDILHKYNADEKQKLFKQKEIPSFFLTQEATCDDSVDESGFMFDASEDQSELLVVPDVAVTDQVDVDDI